MHMIHSVIDDDVLQIHSSAGNASSCIIIKIQMKGYNVSGILQHNRQTKHTQSNTSSFIIPSCIRSNSQTSTRGDGEGITGGGKHGEQRAWTLDNQDIRVDDTQQRKLAAATSDGRRDKRPTRRSMTTWMRCRYATNERYEIWIRTKDEALALRCVAESEIERDLDMYSTYYADVRIQPPDLAGNASWREPFLRLNSPACVGGKFFSD